MYTIVFLLLLSVCDTTAKCLRHCRPDTPQPCPQGYVCEQRERTVHRCYAPAFERYTCGNGVEVNKCDCIEECPDSADELYCSCSNYGSQFVKVPGKFINQYNIETSAKGVEACKSECLANSNCKSFELFKPTSQCFMNSVSAQQAGSNFLSLSFYDFFERKCESCG